MIFSGRTGFFNSNGGEEEPPEETEVPENTMAPVLSGGENEGDLFLVSDGSWLHSPTSATKRLELDGDELTQPWTRTALMAGELIGYVIASNAVGDSLEAATAPLTITALTQIPVNTVAPAISGGATVGAVFAVSDGTWTYSPTSYTKTLKLDGVTLTQPWERTLLMEGELVGYVAATNAAGTSSVTATAPLDIDMLLQPPTITVAPAISGGTAAGDVLTATSGTWANSPTSYAYQWYRGASAISGQTGTTYTVALADEEFNVTVKVTATNQAGASTQATSNAMAIPNPVHAIFATAAIAVSFTRQIPGLGYSGPIGKVKRSSDNTIATFTSKAGYDAFVGAGTGTMQSAYDQKSGAEMPLSSLTVIQGVAIGNCLGIKFTGGTQSIPFVSGQLAQFSTLNGLTVSYVTGNIPAGFANQALVEISQSASATYRHNLRAQSANLEFGGRVADADTPFLYSAGNIGEYSISTAAASFITAELNLFRNGSVVRRRNPFQTAKTSGGAPQSGNIRGLTNSMVSECLIWASALTEAQQALVDKNQRAAYADIIHSATYVGDGIRSWWQRHLDIEHSGILTSTYTTETGAQGVAEIDLTTGKLIDEKILQFGLFPQDDHNGVSQVILNDGTLFLMWTGHGAATDVNGNPNNVTQDHTYFKAKSTTARIADLTAPQTITNSIGKSNYLELFQASNNRIVALTNDDTFGIWLPMESTDNGASFTQKRGLVSLVGGSDVTDGQAQMYMWATQIGDTLRCISNVHPTNSMNAIRLSEYDMLTGSYSSGSGTLGSTASGSTTIAPHNALSAIYTPASGKACRILDMSPDGTMIAFSEFDDADGANQSYNILIYAGSGSIYTSGNWTKKLVVASDNYLWLSSRYVGGMTFAKESHTGIRLYVSRASGAAWYLDRKDSADGGNTWTTTNLVTTASATDKIIRPNSPFGSTAARAVYSRGTYTDYTSWSVSLRIAGP